MPQLKEAPQFAELLSDLMPQRVTVKALSRLVVSFNSYTTRGLPHFWTGYGIVDRASGARQWGAGVSRRAPDGVPEDPMLKAWRTNRSTPNQCTILFIALCRALSVSVRLIVGLDPVGTATPVGSTPQRSSKNKADYLLFILQVLGAGLSSCMREYCRCRSRGRRCEFCAQCWELNAASGKKQRGGRAYVKGCR